jgi:hypothetical protein
MRKYAICCTVSLISNMDPNLKSFEQFFNWYKLYVIDCLEPLERIHIHLSDYKIEPFKVEHDGFQHFFIYRNDLLSYQIILKNLTIDVENIFLYISAWPGREDPVIEHWLEKIKRIVIFGDLHHLSNPLQYAFNLLDKFNPVHVMFWSSIQNADFICARFKIPFSYANYDLKLKQKPRQESDSLSIVRYGNLESSFHPRRTYVNYVTKKEKIQNKPPQKFSDWFKSISSDQIYLHTTLAGNFSHHILFPMKKGAVLLIDASAIHNYYMQPFLIPDKTCITYMPGESLENRLNEFSVKDLNNIGEKGQSQINRFFSDSSTRSLTDYFDSMEYHNMQLHIKSRADLLQELTENISRYDFFTLINLLEILQEMHRFFVKPIPLRIISSNQFLKIMLKLCEPLHYFCIEDEPNRNGIVINFYSQSEIEEMPSDAVKVNTMTIHVSLNKRNVFDGGVFDFLDFIGLFKDRVSSWEKIRVWPQKLLNSIRIS